MESLLFRKDYFNVLPYLGSMLMITILITIALKITKKKEMKKKIKNTTAITISIIINRILNTRIKCSESTYNTTLCISHAKIMFVYSEFLYLS